MTGELQIKLRPEVGDVKFKKYALYSLQDRGLESFRMTLVRELSGALPPSSASGAKSPRARLDFMVPSGTTKGVSVAPPDCTNRCFLSHEAI